jgi:hypothetical protein
MTESSFSKGFGGTFGVLAAIGCAILLGGAVLVGGCTIVIGGCTAAVVAPAVEDAREAVERARLEAEAAALNVEEPVESEEPEEPAADGGGFMPELDSLGDGRLDPDVEEPATPAEEPATPVEEPDASTEGPPAIEYPDMSTEAPAAALEETARVWTAANGKFSLRAEFVAFEAATGLVTLRREDNGREISVALDRLCVEDMTFIRRQIEAGP